MNTNIQIGLRSIQTILNTSSTPGQILDNPLSLGNHQIIFTDTNTSDFMGAINLLIDPIGSIQTISISDNSYLTTTDNTNWHFSCDDTTLTLNYISDLLYLDSSDVTKDVTIRDFITSSYYTGSNIYATDTLMANNPSTGAAINISSPITLSYTGANAFDAGQSTVTQSGSITDSVTINGSSGIITTVSATTASGSIDSFTVNNSCVSSSSVIIVSVSGYIDSTNQPIVSSVNTSNGSFQINIFNAGTSVLDGTINISFICC